MPYYFDLKLNENLLFISIQILYLPPPPQKKSFLFSLVHESILRIFKNV